MFAFQVFLLYSSEAKIPYQNDAQGSERKSTFIALDSLSVSFRPL